MQFLLKRRLTSRESKVWSWEWPRISFVRVPNWETADEKKVPNSAGEVQSAKCEGLESGVESLEKE